MSDTPETDNNAYECIQRFEMGGSTTAEKQSCQQGDCVSADFARKLEREREEARKEVERLKADAELYAGWSKWKDGIWRISHQDSGPSAEWIAEDLDSAMKGAE